MLYTRVWVYVHIYSISIFLDWRLNAIRSDLGMEPITGGLRRQYVTRRRYSSIRIRDSVASIFIRMRINNACSETKATAVPVKITISDSPAYRPRIGENIDCVYVHGRVATAARDEGSF